MALAKTNIVEYIESADFDLDFETTREGAMTFLEESDEPTAALTTPIALAAAVGTDADIRALLWLTACGVNDETVPLGARVYVGDVAGTPTLLVRRVP